MTEDEWLTCENPMPMLVFLRGAVTEEERRLATSRISSNFGDLFPGPSEHVSERKLRLFAAACLQRLWDLPLDEPSKKALTAFQRYAVGEGCRKDFTSACRAIHEIRVQGGKTVLDHLGILWRDDAIGASNAASHAAWAVAHEVAKDSVAVTCANAEEEERFMWGFCGVPDPLWQATRMVEERCQADLLRHIVGNPFRPSRPDPSWPTWREGLLPALAGTIETTGDFGRLPILADALEEAGCMDAAILTHCRAGGDHPRGCWLLDMLLRRE